MTSPRVLVVEDHSSVRTLLRVVLEAEGYRVMEADDGSAALEIAQHESVDLVLLDLMMPRLDGELVIGKMRTNAKLSAVPVIVVTAKQEAVERMRDLLGKDNVFTKPFEQEELLTRVRELIGPGKPLPSSPWKG